MMSEAISGSDDNMIHVDSSVDPIRNIEVRPFIPRLPVYSCPYIAGQCVYFRPCIPGPSVYPLTVAVEFGNPEIVVVWLSLFARRCMTSVAISRMDDSMIHVDGSVDPIRDIEVRPSIPGPSVYFRTVLLSPNRPFISGSSVYPRGMFVSMREALHDE